VIPRIVHSRWRRQEQFAFGRGKSARSLRIFVDGETVPDSPHLDVLLAFAHHPEVELIGTDDRFPHRLHVGAYDPQNAHTPWEIEFEGGRRLSYAVMGPDIQSIGRGFAEPGHEERGERAIVMVRSPPPIRSSSRSCNGTSSRAATR